ARPPSRVTRTTCPTRTPTRFAPRSALPPPGTTRDGGRGRDGAAAPRPVRDAGRLSAEPLLRGHRDDDAACGGRLARLRADGIGVPPRLDRHRAVSAGSRAPAAGRLACPRARPPPR